MCTNPFHRAAFCLFIVYGLLTVEMAHGSPRQPARYALLVGSNRAGPGQKALRFAHEDVRRMQEVLTELGGYPRDQVWTVLDPNVERLEAALSHTRSILEKHAQLGERTIFLFYYSGHARADALNLGDEEMRLSYLREKLHGMSATFTLALLDACQSGAIAGVKGAKPEAAFSHNSIEDLQAAGVVVMASSTASELSQESPELGGSFFTHHLVAGLRGAADKDLDGRVTLSEVYGYTYNRTLADTAETRVGQQHVSLETAMRGKGEMVLTYLSEANSGLWLPHDLQGKVLVQHVPSGTVQAEVYKVEGHRLRLAFPPGSYVMVLRSGGRIWKCEITLESDKTVELAVDRCREVPATEGVPKAGKKAWWQKISLELALGGLVPQQPGVFESTTFFYNIRNGDGSEIIPDDNSSRLQVFGSFVYHLGWTISTVITFGLMSVEELRFSESGESDTLFISTFRVGFYLRTSHPIMDGWLVPYAQIGGGFSFFGFRGSDIEDIWTHHFGLATGLQVMPWQHLGFFVQAEFIETDRSGVDVRRLPGCERECTLKSPDNSGFICAAGFRYQF